MSLSDACLDQSTRCGFSQPRSHWRRDAPIDIVRGVNATPEPPKIAEVSVDRATTGCLRRAGRLGDLRTIVRSADRARPDQNFCGSRYRRGDAAQSGVRDR
jgi:hypothetical protein